MAAAAAVAEAVGWDDDESRLKTDERLRATPLPAGSSRERLTPVPAMPRRRSGRDRAQRKGCGLQENELKTIVQSGKMGKIII